MIDEESQLFPEIIVEEYENDDDICQQIRDIYPLRETQSRFSIHNPNTRFSAAPDQMRQTVMLYQKVGKPEQFQIEEEDENGDFIEDPQSRPIRE